MKRLTIFVGWLVETGRHVIFYGTHPRDHLVVDDIVDGLSRENARQVEKTYTIELGELLGIIDRADIVVATRFHGILLPFLMGKPVLGLEYWKKTSDLMKYMGQGDYVLSDEEFLSNPEFDVTRLETLYSTLEANRENECETIRERLADRERILAAQYEDVLAIARTR